MINTQNDQIKYSFSKEQIKTNVKLKTSVQFTISGATHDITTSALVSI